MRCLKYLSASGNIYSSIFRTNGKASGFDMIKPYSDLFRKSLYPGKRNKGALSKTAELLIDYLLVLEKLDYKSPNYDLYITFKIELDKIEFLPLFGKFEIQNQLSYYKDYSFISLTLKKLMQLFFDLSEKLFLSTDPESYKSIIAHEHQYIKSILNLQESLFRKNLSKQKDYQTFQLASRTLQIQFSELHKESVLDKKTGILISNIETRNYELNLLCIKINARFKGNK